MLCILDAMADTAIDLTQLDPPEPEWTLGERIRKTRNLMHLGQRQFGALFTKKVSSSLVSKWEKGTREPKLSELREIESWGIVPKGFLVRSRWTALGELRGIRGGSKGPAKTGQLPLPLFVAAADN